MTEQTGREKGISIIVPVYDEADNFRQLWSQLTDSLKCKFTCYVVYDFEADNTIPVIKEIIGIGEDRLHLVKNQFGKGVVGAIRTGFAAVKGGPLLVVMADLSDDLAEVDTMLAMHHRGFDLVAASRYMKGGKLVGGSPFKQMLSRLAGVSLFWLRGVPTHDATNAFKLYDKQMLEQITIESSGGFELNLEITIKAFLAGYRIAEIPTTWIDRQAGQSRFKIWAWLPKYLKWYLYAFRPRRNAVNEKPVPEHARD